MVIVDTAGKLGAPGPQRNPQAFVTQGIGKGGPPGTGANDSDFGICRDDLSGLRKLVLSFAVLELLFEILPAGSLQNLSYRPALGGM